MPLTFSEAIEKYNEYRFELSVWSEVVSYLSTMLTFETHAAEKAIITEEDKVPVPEEVIEQTINVIQKEKIEPLQEKIGSFSKLSMETKEHEPRQKKSREGQGTEGKEGEGQATQNKVRTAIRRPGRTN